MARLDLPTYEDDLIQQQLQQSVSHSTRSSIAWDVVSTFLKIGSSAIRLISELYVLMRILEDQQDGNLLLLLACGQLFLEWYGKYRGMLERRGSKSFMLTCRPNVNMFTSLGCHNREQGLYHQRRPEARCKLHHVPQRSRCRRNEGLPVVP